MDKQKIDELLKKLKADLLAENDEEGKCDVINERFERRGIDPEEVIGQLAFEVSMTAFMKQQTSHTPPQVALAGMLVMGILLGLDIADERAVEELSESLRADVGGEDDRQ
jgi:hypothetical protein